MNEILSKIRAELEAQPSPRTYEVARALAYLDSVDSGAISLTPIERLEKANEALVELAELVKRGLDSGHIKAKPIITMDPDAESLPVKCLEDFVDAALKLAKEPA